jgi:hypothetical protein
VVPEMASVIRLVVEVMAMPLTVWQMAFMPKWCNTSAIT